MTLTAKPPVETSWVNPFLAPGSPYTTATVLYHHPDEPHSVPAIICAVRGKDATGITVSPTTDPTALRDWDLGSGTGPITVEARLCILRPGVIEWKWAAQGEVPRMWSWPRLPEWVNGGSGDCG